MVYLVYRRWSKTPRCTNPDCLKIFFNGQDYKEGTYAGSDGYDRCRACHNLQTDSGWEIEQLDEASLLDCEKPVSCIHCQKQHAILHEPSWIHADTRELLSFDRLKQILAKETDEDGVFNCVNCGEKNKITMSGEDTYSLEVA